MKTVFFLPVYCFIANRERKLLIRSLFSDFGEFLHFSEPESDKKKEYGCSLKEKSHSILIFKWINSF
jgi:hypothetical protein